MMDYAILGPLELRADDDAVITAPSGRPARLLTALLLNANQTVPLDLLTELLWESRPPASYRSNLQTYVSRLRKIGMNIGRSEAGYAMQAQPESIDVHRFQAHITAGERYTDHGDDNAASRSFRQALELYRGLPFNGDGGPFHGNVYDIVERRCTAVERLSEIDVRHGRNSAAIRRLRSLLAENRLREPLWGLLIEALAAAGRTAEAFTSYEKARRTIRDELGVSPGPLLRQTHVALLSEN